MKPTRPWRRVFGGIRFGFTGAVATQVDPMPVMWQASSSLRCLGTVGFCISMCYSVLTLLGRIYIYIYTHNLTLRIRTLKWKGFVPLILSGVSVPCYGEFHEGLMYLGPTYCSEPEGSQQQNQPSRLRGAQPGPRLLRVNLPSQVVHQFDRLGQVEHLFHSAKDGGQHNHGVSRYQGSPHMSFVAPVLMPSRGDAPSV